MGLNLACGKPEGTWYDPGVNLRFPFSKLSAYLCQKDVFCSPHVFVLSICVSESDVCCPKKVFGVRGVSTNQLFTGVGILEGLRPISMMW